MVDLKEETNMCKFGRAGYPFITVGIAFMVIGFSGQKAFIAIGAAFLVAGLIALKGR
jgi:hypothetical protein